MSELISGTTSMPESSVMTVRNGELIIILRSTLFPATGGAQCGHSYSEFNLTQHLRDLIKEAIADPANGEREE